MTSQVLSTDSVSSPNPVILMGNHRLGMLTTEQRRYAEAERFERAAEAACPTRSRTWRNTRMRHNDIGDAQRWWRIARTVMQPVPQPLLAHMRRARRLTCATGAATPVVVVSRSSGAEGPAMR